MLPGSFDEWLDREWLLTNGRGGFASSTLIGCPTRREHGWMNWSLPGQRLERWMLWSHAAENLHVDNRTYLLANFEFNSAVDPHGYRHLSGVELTLDDQFPSIAWSYKLETAQVRRTLMLVHGEDLVVVRYHIQARPEAELRMVVWPMIACRPLNGLRRRSVGELFQMSHEAGAIGVRYRLDPRISFGLVGRRCDAGPHVEFNSRGDWWYNFRYRREVERGLECGEDLCVPGAFMATGKGTIEMELIGVAGTHDVRQLWRRVRHFESVRPESAATDASHAPRVTIRGKQNGEDNGATLQGEARPPDVMLPKVGRQFVFRQPHIVGPGRIGLIAGYPWLEEYTRDACVAIPGLLLCSGRVEEARELLLRIALLRRDGALPSHLYDEPEVHDYVNADGALWFVHAVDEYLTATDENGPAATELLKAGLDIVRSLAADERKGMRLDSDGLLICENPAAAATWMDARYAWVFSTPRIGKPVEVNALWYHALCVLAERVGALDPEEADHCHRLANRVRSTFATTFWNESLGGLYDVVGPAGPDASIRPNQILAVGLRHSALSDAQQAAVVRLVRHRLLTPVGLRSLSPDDPAYVGRYEGSIEARERVAHQGQVYPWLMGMFIDAFLRVHGRTPRAKAEAREMLEALAAHVCGTHSLDGISELFDGESPHTPRGCISQAWSVAEVLRAWMLTAPGDAPLYPPSDSSIAARAGVTAGSPARPS